MKEITVSLGGRNYTVSALPIAQSKVWREKLAIPFSDLAKALTMASEMASDEREFKLSDVSTIVQSMSGILLGSVDMMLGLMYDYAPVLAQDKEWIENNSYDEEALHVFSEVLKLAFPFGVLLEVVTGRTVSKTSSSLLSPNGGSSLPASGPVRREKAKK